jgi:catechol 2,3-dioxygenase-like lactoylglutathione lyase family enzyme
VTIRLDHVIVPARNHRASAELLATLLGVPWSKSGVGSFCPVYVNDGLTLDFDQVDGPMPALHFCFRVSETEFDRIFERIKARGIQYRSGPHGPMDMRVGTHDGGRIVYWSEPDGHVWEALTVSYARQPAREKSKSAERARASRRPARRQPGSARSGR